jgi:uncharacterized protein
MNGLHAPFALALLVTVCACTSAPIRYYTLTPPPEKSMAASAPAIAVDVRLVHTPALLNRSELMVRTGASEVTLLENERWASPLKQEIKDALRLELQQRLGRTTEMRPAFTALTLDIEVQHFEAQLGRYAWFEASWSAVLSASGAPSNDARRKTCSFQADEGIHPGYAGIVAGYQQEIAALAESIVAVLMSPASSSDALCH